MPLRQVLKEISPTHHNEPIGCLIRQICRGAEKATNGKTCRIWLAEEISTGRYFFYLAGNNSRDEQKDFKEEITPVVDLKDRKFGDVLQELFPNTNCHFVPIVGIRFGQKSDGEYLKPVRTLVGALEVENGANLELIVELAELCAQLIWNHRSARFLNMENEVATALKQAREQKVDWTLIEPTVLKLCHSTKFAVFSKNKGKIQDRLGAKKTLLGEKYYREVIDKHFSTLEKGRWRRSIVPVRTEESGNCVFWMLVPLNTAHYHHKNPRLKITERVQHFVILETRIEPSQFGRFIYSSADRRLLEHSLTRYLDGIAEYRIEQHAKKVTQQLPEILPKDPHADLLKIVKAAAGSIYDVVDICVVSPMKWLENKDDPTAAFSSNALVRIDEFLIERLLKKDNKMGARLVSKQVAVLKMGSRSSLIFNVGSALLPRYMIFLFEEPYSSYVTTEICSRVAARIQLFWQSCDLQMEKTASLTEIAHVLRGPVNSALEDLRAVARDRTNSNIHSFQVSGARSESEIMADVINYLSRARSITDSAKQLISEDPSKTFQRRRVDLISILSEVRASLEVERHRKRNIFKTLDGLNRHADSKVYISGDDDLLWLLIYNLLENAVKYSRRESEISITLSEPKKDVVRIAIRNVGDLIWDFDFDRIFVPFQRAFSSLAMNGKEGTGIGLPTANQIAKAFNPNSDGGVRLWQSSTRTQKNTTGEIEFSVDLLKFN